jgi:hypothetical protein
MLLRTLFAFLLPLSLLAHAGDCSQCGGCKVVLPDVEPEHCHWLEVTGVEPGGQAAALGVVPGDVIHSYNGASVGCLDDLRGSMASVDSGPVTVVLIREGNQLPLAFQAGKLGVYLKEWRKDIVPDPDAVIIPGVPALGWHTGKQASSLAALEAARQPLGKGPDYTFLMGCSGQAFRFQFHEEWCPSSPAPEVGAPTLERAFRAYGLTMEDHQLSTDGKNQPAVLEIIKAGIDSGFPVLGCGLTDQWEWGAIYGYQQLGEDLFCRSYGDTRKDREIARQFPWSVIIPRRTGKPDELRAAHEGFAGVVADLEAEKHGRYFSGTAAFREWADRLRTEDFTSRDSAGFSEVIQANYWSFARLIHDRETGVEYLKSLAEDPLPHFKPMLDSLVGLYEQELALLRPFEEKLACPGTGIDPADWTVEERAPQAEVVESVLKLEEQALPVWQMLALAEN